MIAGIVLAAGEGRRIGQPKAWLPTGREGESFFSRACSVLVNAGATPVVGVIPSAGAALAHAAAPGAVLVVNRWPDEGQLTSLQLGLRALSVLGTEAEAALVLPVDVPLVSEATVRALVTTWRASYPLIARPTSPDGRHGHPVLFSATLFADLLGADPSAGAKPIVRAHASAEGDVLIEDEGAFLDVDTAEDYERAFGRRP